MQVDTLNGETQGVRDKMGNWEGMRSIDESIGDDAIQLAGLEEFMTQYRELSKGFEIDREWLRGWREGEG